MECRSPICSDVVYKQVSTFDSRNLTIFRNSYALEVEDAVDLRKVLSDIWTGIFKMRTYQVCDRDQQVVEYTYAIRQSVGRMKYAYALTLAEESLNKSATRSPTASAYHDRLGHCHDSDDGIIEKGGNLR